MSDESKTEAQLCERVAQLEAELKDARQTIVELQETADQWRVLAENAPAIIVTVDRDGTILFTNGIVRSQISIDEVIGRNVREYLAPKDLETVLGALEKVFATGEPHVYEVSAPFPDGDMVHYSVQIGPLMRGSEIVAAITVTTDVTEHKRADEALKRSAANLSATLDATADGILAVDDQGKILFSNRRSAELWGIEPSTLESNGDAVVLRRILEQLSDPDAFFSEARRLYATAEAGFGTLHFKDGRVIEHYSSPLQQDESARPVRVWSFRDVTERQRAEEELRHLRNYLSNIIDSMPSVLVGVDPDGKVTQWNREAQRITGVSPGVAAGKPLEHSFPRLAGEMQRVHEALRTREAQTDSRKARQEDGETRYEDVTIYPLVANGIDGAVIRVDDVTEKVRLEEMMVQSEKMLSVGGLAAGMAHEINNPLAGMVQAAGVLADRLLDAELPANKHAAREAGISMEAIGAYVQSRKIAGMLGHIRESGTRAAEIVTNMLSFARKSGDTWATHSLENLLRRCVDLAGADYDLSKQYDFRRIETVWECEDDLPRVLCDAGKIRQVLLNILRNGAEAMHEGSKDGRPQAPRFVFRLSNEPEIAMVSLEIEDNGPGMEEEIRKRVFEPFFTTKPTGVGTGLGMSVSYFIITESHDGEIWVESTPGKGTKFIIRLPGASPPRLDLPPLRPVSRRLAGRSRR